MPFLLETCYRDIYIATTTTGFWLKPRKPFHPHGQKPSGFTGYPVRNLLIRVAKTAVAATVTVRSGAFRHSQRRYFSAARSSTLTGDSQTPAARRLQSTPGLSKGLAIGWTITQTLPTRETTKSRRQSRRSLPPTQSSLTRTTRRRRRHRLTRAIWAIRQASGQPASTVETSATETNDSGRSDEPGHSSPG